MSRPLRCLARTALALVLLTATAAAKPGAPPGTQPTPDESYPDVFGPDVKAGYALREEGWNGSLPVGDKTPIRQQLFKNNDYRFYVWSTVKGAKVSVHIYDEDGNLVDGETTQKAEGTTQFAEVDVKPGATGSYYLIVKVEQSSSKATAWQMAYAYK